METIDYIKDSLDNLHIKVDVLKKDMDDRIMSLELTRAEQKGSMKTMSIISAIVGGAIATAVNYISNTAK